LNLSSANEGSAKGKFNARPPPFVPTSVVRTTDEPTEHFVG
jgi:hypothetical protein